jgi:SAM-dependent methyltransferase
LCLGETPSVESSFEAHRERRNCFGTDVAAYERGRPGYPERVYELLRDHCGLGPGRRVVEIGPGTGQATRRLLDAGASVVAVELSEEMAHRLASSTADERLTVTVGAFEEVALRPATADLIVSATAFHWVPTEAGLHRCADVLGDGGWLALWWNVYGDRSRPDPFHDALAPVLERLAPSLSDLPGTASGLSGVPYALDSGARIAEIESVGRFGAVHHEQIPWRGRHDVDELVALYSSFSTWLALPGAQRSAVLDALEQLARDDFDGVVERPYLTSLYITQKAG